MPMQKPKVSATELEVLKELWEGGAATVRDLAERLEERGREWAYTTVQTLLTRLREKGYAERDESGQAHVYRAAVSREGLLRSRLGDLADQLCEGDASPLVHALVSNHRFSPGEIAGFRRLLDEMEEGGAE